MYTLKNKYKGCTISIGGYAINLDSVKSNKVEDLNLQDYFIRKSVKKG